MICNMFKFLWRGVGSTLPNSQAGEKRLVGCPLLLIQHISSYPPYLEAVLHLQPEDAPCLGDRYPLILDWKIEGTEN